MSLLLEALKKAEKAKEEAQRRARAESGGASSELQIAGEAAPAAEAKPVLTRDKLPDIKQALEILSDDLSPKPPPAALPKASAPQPAPAAQPRPQPEKREPDAQAAERASAKKVFEAKFKEPNPRMPFYIAMGVLGVFAVSTVGYFWYQLRPPPALVNANPPRPSGEPPVAAAESKPVPAPAAAASAAQPSIPGLPGAAPAPAAPLPPAAAPAAPSQAAPRAAEAPPPPKPPARAPAAPPAAAPERATELAVSRPTPQIHPKVDAAYSAYLSGDLATARAEYQQALREEPANRDALLGLAAVDVRTGRYEAAEAGYLRLLQSDPRDSHAQAALIALRGGRSDPLAAESRVKSLLAADPGAHVLNFTLGNQLAQQGRWAEAQQEYFKAFAAEPNNADFAYNLAVSLDHLRQPRLALEYYQRAIALAAKRGASFDPAAARSRAAQLGP